VTTQRLALERSGAFRRRRFVVPHRRRSRTRMLLKPFLLAVVLVGLPVAAALWVYTSPRFMLREVQVGSTRHIPAAEVGSALAPLRGRHLLGLSLSEVEDLLITNPWVEKVAVRKELPDRLVVEIEERLPVALLRQDGRLFYVDGEGFVMGDYELDGPVDLPLLSLVPGAALDVAAALELASELRRLAPTTMQGLSEIEVLGLGDYRVHTAGLDFPVLVSSTELEKQLEKLVALLPEMNQRFDTIEAVDLRFTRQIVIQPAGDPRSQEG
jgi:cell division protein FtsQ